MQVAIAIARAEFLWKPRSGVKAAVETDSRGRLVRAELPVQQQQQLGVWLHAFKKDRKYLISGRP